MPLALGVFCASLKRSAALAALGCALFSLTPANAASTEVKVCAVPQLYLALEHLHDVLPQPFVASYDTPGALYQRLNNAADTTSECDLLLSSDERLPITLIRAHKGLGSAMLPFTRAPLVIWSQDESLFLGLSAQSAVTGADPWDEPVADPWDEAPPRGARDPWDGAAVQRNQDSMAFLLEEALDAPKHELAQALAQVNLTSMAYANPHLTPVGYASHQVLEAAKEVAAKLPAQLNEFEHEYVVYNQVRSGLSQCGLISKPLVVANEHQGAHKGSYLTLARRLHADIQYYVLLMEQSKNKVAAQELMHALRDDPKVQSVLSQFGFAPLAPNEP